MLKNYEINLFLNPSLSEEEINKILEKIRNYILDGKGIIIEEKKYEKVKLPYKVKKFKEGFYVFIKFSYDKNNIAFLREKVKLTDGIIRLMISVAVEKEMATKNTEGEEAKVEEGTGQVTNEIDTLN